MKRFSYFLTAIFGMLMGGFLLIKLLKRFPELLYTLFGEGGEGGETRLSRAQKSLKMKKESYEIDEKDDSFI